MSKTAKIIVGLIVIILIIWGISAATKKGGAPTSSEPIKIGFIGPLTGNAANVGQNAKAAIEIALSEVNADGGIYGRPLEIIYEDGKCTSKDAAAAAQKLINVDKVPVVFGGACSGETSAFTGLAEQSKTVVLSYCSSAAAITNAGDYIFRNYPSDNFQGVFAADYIKNKLNKSKVAILYIQTDWGIGLNETFSKKFVELGGTVVASEGFQETNKDFRSQLSKIKVANPDVIYFLGYAGQTVPALKQLADLKYKVSMFGGDAWDDQQIITDAGSAAEGIYFTVPSSSPSEIFKTAMKTKVGTDEIAVCTPTAYDGVHILAQVLKNAGVEPTAIKDELYKTVYAGGVSSKEISFDSNGDPKTADYTVKIVKNGKIEVVQ